MKERESTKDFYYTDGSKKDGKTGFAVVKNDDIVIRKRTPDHCSIFTVEAFAILETIKVIEGNDNSNYSIIFTDSASTIRALTSTTTRNPLIKQIQRTLLETSKSIQICWIPGHTGIAGNEMADLAAKQAAELVDVSAMINTPSDVKNLAINAFTNRATQQWMTQSTHLNQIKNELIRWATSNLANRRESTIICRLRIGHTNLTHINRIFGNAPTICDKCPARSPLTVEHIVLDCTGFARQRRAYNIPVTLKEALGDDPDVIKRVLEYLKDIKIYSSI